MKLYMHPVSMTSRPVRLFIAENGIEIDEQVVDLMQGKHYQEPYVSLNPNRLVPMLEDGDFRLTESASILKYLAEKYDLPSYPNDLRQRAKVNEIMDWFQTNFYRDYGYGLCYPQIFPNHRREDPAAQAEVIRRGKENSQYWLKVLNDYWIGPKKAYLTGDSITIADYFGVSLLTLGEILRVDFGKYPNVARWLANMKKLKSWNKVNEALYGFAGMVKDQTFETV